VREQGEKVKTSRFLGALALLALLAAAAGCPRSASRPPEMAAAPPPPKKSFVFREAPWRPPEAPICKPQAPVSIDAIAWSDSATVQVTFLQAATGVRVAVWGTDGLVVTSDANPVVNESFAANATIELHVAYSPLDEESCLAVSVEGAFGTNPLRNKRVVSFTVPPASGKKPAGERKSPGKLSVDDSGRRIIDMPATEVK